MTYTEKELNQFLHGISLSLLSKKSAQHWRYDEETAKEIEWLEALERKVRADKADHKTENGSEKPNNCKTEPRKEQNFCGKCRYLYRDFKYGLSCYRLMDNEPCKYEERKDEPTISKIEQVEEEPKTQMKTQNSNLAFEKRKCVDCNFLTYMFGKTWCNIKCENPHDKVCDRFKPKDDPQTDCPWR